MSFGPPGSPPSAFASRPAPLRLPTLPVLRSPQGLATALTVLLSAAALVNLVAAGVGVYSWSLLQDMTAETGTASAAAFDRAADAAMVAASFQLLAQLGTAVVFLIWFHRVRANGQVFDPTAFTWSHRWAVGSWFVPVGNFFLPYLIARETWRASAPLAPDGSRRPTSLAPVASWWIVWLLSVLSNLPAEQLYKRADSMEQLAGACAVDAFSALVTVAAAVLAILFVRRLTAFQDARARGTYAAV
ncbi:DUF4328 domain-containing protein [Streptomyces sp. NPDC006687]|uniref:DUF4328 domain-containing protein n=1 Tax=unclassified Streptomyces TaxID=2593676 RepID=UPI0033E8512E